MQWEYFMAQINENGQYFEVNNGQWRPLNELGADEWEAVDTFPVDANRYGLFKKEAS